MSISLPNGTLLAAPSTSTQQYTAAVTRILHLANFSAQLKTRDLQGMFREYENEKGGFRIKWLDDTNALVVFSDAATAKRAYLAFLLSPPTTFGGVIRPYDKPDAAQIIQSLAARSMGHRGSASVVAQGNGSDALGASGAGIINGGGGIGNHGRTLSTSSSSFGTAGGSGFLNAKRASISTSGGTSSSGAGRHIRTGSGAGAAAFSRQPLSGIGGVLNFGGSNGGGGGGGRLTTHNENALSRSASSSDTEPIISMDPPGLGSSMNGGWRLGGGQSHHRGSNMGGGGGPSGKARRESSSAEKAMKEVEKALASVEIKT